MTDNKQSRDAWQKSEVRELVEMGIEVSPEASFINGFDAASQALVADGEAGLKADGTLLGTEGLTPAPKGVMDAFMQEREWQLTGRLPEQVLADDVHRDWKYRTDVPEGEADRLFTIWNAAIAAHAQRDEVDGLVWCEHCLRETKPLKTQQEAVTCYNETDRQL